MENGELVPQNTMSTVQPGYLPVPTIFKLNSWQSGKQTAEEATRRNEEYNGGTEDDELRSSWRDE